MGRKMAGTKFITLILVRPSMFKDSATISKEPTQVISAITAIAQIGLEKGGHQGNGALIEQNGHCGESHAQSREAPKTMELMPSSRDFGKQCGVVAGKAVLQSAYNGHGTDAEEQAGGDKAFGNGGLSAVGDQMFRAFLHPVPQRAHPLVQVQQLSDQGTQYPWTKWR